MAHKHKRNDGPQSRAPLKWGEGAKNLTARRHHGCPNNVPTKVRENLQKMRIGTWNVRSMLEKGKLENIKREMDRMRVSILGLSEVRWKGRGDFVSDGYRVIYSCGEESQRGVAVIMHKDVAGKVSKVMQQNDRLLLVKIKAEPVDMIIIQTYMPTSAHCDEEVEGIYEQIEELVDGEKANDNVVILGDWNAVVGQGRDDKVVGEYGVGNRNERGEKLIEFCKMRKLMVANTWFKHHKRKIYTWRKPGDTERYQLDYILVKQRYRNGVKNARSYPSADANSDHNLVLIEMDIKMKKLRKREMQKKWDIEKLKANAHQYAKEVNIQLQHFTDKCLTVEEHWKAIKAAVIKSAEISVGYKSQKRAKKPWVSVDMLDKMDERRKWKNIRTMEGQERYKQLHKELRRETEQAREKWWTTTCNDLMEMDRRGRADRMYTIVKSVSREKSTARANTVIRDGAGVLLTEGEEIRERWACYVEELYDKNGKPDLISMSTGSEDLVAEDEKGPGLLQEEVTTAIKEMKSKKAEGVDGIPAEFWKAIDDEGINEVVKLCRKMYKQGKWPEEFTKSIVIPIPKKQNAMDCGDYRTISLIPHASKILLKILTKRIENKAKDYISETQFGFRKGVGTREAIGTMRMLCQRTLEHDKEIYVCFVDFEKAFDRVKWRKLMDVLKDIGVDWRDRRLISELYMQQEAVIRLEGEMTRSAIIGRGVRQGCLLSPILFSIYVESMMKEAMEGSEDGVKVGGYLLQDVRFADDQAMVDSSEAGLQRTMSRLEQTASVYDMKINIKKTKVMRICRTGGKKMHIAINGQQVEQVQHFQYLGTWISENGSCEREIRTRIGVAKESFKKHKELLTKTFNKELKKKIVKTMIWTVALYGSECWTLKKVDVRRLQAFEMWIWRRIERISWTDRITNEEVLRRVAECRSLINTVVRRKKNWIGHVVRGSGIMKVVMEGRMEGKRTRGRRRKGMLDELMEEHSYVEMKRRAEDRDYWRKWVPKTCLLAEH